MGVGGSDESLFLGSCSLSLCGTFIALDENQAEVCCWWVSIEIFVVGGALVIWMRSNVIRIFYHCSVLLSVRQLAGGFG